MEAETGEASISRQMPGVTEAGREVRNRFTYRNSRRN